MKRVLKKIIAIALIIATLGVGGYNNDMSCISINSRMTLKLLFIIIFINLISI